MLNEIRQVIAETELLVRPVDALSDSDDLFEAGLTSYGSVRVMLALEDRFDVEFPEALLTRKTFATFSAMAAAVGSLVGARV